ncbi:MAG: DNA polymerase III beta subunit, partial [uncultured Solirubrobacteraceae bacterium]
EALHHEPGAARPAADRIARGVDPLRRPGPLGRPGPCGRRRGRAAGHRHGDRPARPADRPGRARGDRGPARAPDARRRPPAALGPAHARAALLRGGRRDHLRARALPHPHAAHGGLPHPAGARRRPGRGPAGQGLRGHRREGGPVGVPRRDAPHPHRHPRLRERHRAADGGHGLLPAEREGDAARGADRGRLRGQRARAGAPGARAHRGRRDGRPDHRDAGEPGRLPGRLRRPVLAAHRRPVPQLPPAPARDVRARAAHPGRGADRRGPPGVAHGPEERAAAPVVRRRRAHRERPDARRGGGLRAPARPVRRRAVRDRVQPGLPQGRPGVRGLGGRRAQAHLAAAARAHRGGGRLGVPLPDHADPPERL